MQSLTPGEAAGIMTAVQVAMDRGLVPDEWHGYLEEAWAKLRDASHDRCITVYTDVGYEGFGDDGWYIVLNGCVVHGPFETEARAIFFWQCRPTEQLQ